MEKSARMDPEFPKEQLSCAGPMISCIRAHTGALEEVNFLYRSIGCSLSAHKCRVSFVQVRRFQISRIALGLTLYFLANLADRPPWSGSKPHFFTACPKMYISMACSFFNSARGPDLERLLTWTSSMSCDSKEAMWNATRLQFSDYILDVTTLELQRGFLL